MVESKERMGSRQVARKTQGMEIKKQEDQGEHGTSINNW